RRTMVCLPGIVGQLTGDARRTMREFDYPLPSGAAVILHSDGLTDRWDMADYPGLGTRTAVVVAATLLRDAGRRGDAASVLAATGPAVWLRRCPPPPAYPLPRRRHDNLAAPSRRDRGRRLHGPPPGPRDRAAARVDRAGSDPVRRRALRGRPPDAGRGRRDH